MIKIDITALEMRIKTMQPMLNEYQRRMFLSTEAKAIGYGGISLVSRISGVSRQTLTGGVKELDSPESEPIEQGRCRKAGAGRKKVWETHPEILTELTEMLEAHTKGDPMRLLLWTNKSLRKLSSALLEKGYSANKDTVGEILRMLGYGLAQTQRPLRLNQFENGGMSRAWLNTNMQTKL